jgi:peroxiredoxin
VARKGLTPPAFVHSIVSFARRHVRALLHVLGVLALWFGLSAYQSRNHIPAGAAAAPAFTLADLSGRGVSLTEYRGRKVVLHFFATWCGVCKAELPSVRALQRGLDEDEVLLAIVADGEDPEHVRRFATEHELTYPILLATDEVLRAYAVDRFPTNYYLNADGSVSASTTGLSTWLGMKTRLFSASN